MELNYYFNRNRESWGTIVLLVLQYGYSRTRLALLSLACRIMSAMEATQTNFVTFIFLQCPISGGCFPASRQGSLILRQWELKSEQHYSLRSRNIHCEMR
ncbi:hypothetical protein Csa_021710 [Cucumis sativus]|uniref:Uncharacterized protein n=1 Tax=Cucumis sativus TaxID=3659 RepID=A0A0A0KD32_CUCSA|nr:hypothetical protein Csa_021710 [Cucumis sativus]